MEAYFVMLFLCLFRMVPTWLSSCSQKATRWGYKTIQKHQSSVLWKLSWTHERRHTQSDIPSISCIQPARTPEGSWRNMTAWRYTDSLTLHSDKTSFCVGFLTLDQLHWVKQGTGWCNTAITSLHLLFLGAQHLCNHNFSFLSAELKKLEPSCQSALSTLPSAAWLWDSREEVDWVQTEYADEEGADRERVVIKRSAEAGRKSAVNKGSEVRAQCPPSNGLPLDQVLLSSPIRSSSLIPPPKNTE